MAAMIGALLLGLSLAAIPTVRGYEYAKELCPQQCTQTGLDRANWTHYYDFQKLQHCEKTFLWEMNIYNDIDSAAQVVRACTTGDVAGSTIARRTTQFRRFSSDNSTDQGINSTQPLACEVPGAPADTRQIELHISSSNANNSSPKSSSSIVSAALQLQSFVASESNCNTTMLFAKSGNAVVAIYVGYQIQKKSAASILQQFIDHINTNPTASGSMIAETCAELQGVVLNTQTIGIFASADGDLSSARQALVSWDSGKCLTGTGSSTKSMPATVEILSAILGGGHSSSAKPDTNSTLAVRETSAAAGTCSYVQVAQDDGCWSLATQKCKISTDDFYKYNANGNSDKFCTSGIFPGDYVCCSPGSLPDFSPKPNADGTCASYTVVANDGCKTIADKNSIKDFKKLDEYNKNTWGWQGCSAGVGLGQIICVSSGTPNMPSIDPNAVCGPQVTSTTKPTDGTDWAMLNQCPLKACCNVWGQCGTFTHP
jgi:chitinase